ncbi:MAG: hypothetical protein ACXVRN_11235 [Solirubrobacteraceae bacterium]
MRNARLLVLEAEVIAALSATVAALDLALESLAYSDARSAPTANQLGIGPPCTLELHQQISSALGGASADELPRLSALLAVVSAVERIASHCAAIANLVPDMAPALRKDDKSRRALELAGVEARSRLVHARDALQTTGVTTRGATPTSSVAPVLLEHLDQVGDDADEIGELAASASRTVPPASVAPPAGSPSAPPGVLTASAAGP